jgi:hypothetical protein
MGEIAPPVAWNGMLPDVDQLGTVVVCEDDEPTLELLCEHLTADRYRALPAPSASDALRLCHFKQSEGLLLAWKRGTWAAASAPASGEGARWNQRSAPGLRPIQASRPGERDARKHAKGEAKVHVKAPLVPVMRATPPCLAFTHLAASGGWPA